MMRFMTMDVQYLTMLVMLRECYAAVDIRCGFCTGGTSTLETVPRGG